MTVCARSSREAEQGPAEGWELMCLTWAEAKGSWSWANRAETGVDGQQGCEARGRLQLRRRGSQRAGGPERATQQPGLRLRAGLFPLGLASCPTQH